MSNTKTYNATFTNDAGRAQFVQYGLTRSQIKKIAETNRKYVPGSFSWNSYDGLYAQFQLAGDVLQTRTDGPFFQGPDTWTVHIESPQLEDAA